MNLLATIFVAAIVAALAWKSQPALPPVITRSGVAANQYEPSGIANPSDVGARKGFHLLGRLLAWKSQKGTIMPRKLAVKNAAPLKDALQELDFAIEAQIAFGRLLFDHHSLIERTHELDQDPMYEVGMYSLQLVTAANLRRSHEAIRHLTNPERHA
jgi:hypothetical protein